ncbi:hypothetical protein B0H10DRAFT_2006388, partial [Mycena sp. CBHHK59/15]
LLLSFRRYLFCLFSYFAQVLLTPFAPGSIQTRFFLSDPEVYIRCFSVYPPPLLSVLLFPGASLERETMVESWVEDAWRRKYFPVPGLSF